VELKPGYKQTEVGVIPEEWDVLSMNRAAEVIDPQPDHRTPPENRGGDPYIGISDFLDDSTVDWDASRKIVPRAVENQRARFQIRSGDIIFGKIGTIGMPKFVPAPDIRYGLSANVLLLQAKVEPNFLMAWLRSETFQRAVGAELHSTSQAAFGINKMRRMLVPAPPPPEQRAIAEALSDVDALLGGLDRLITKKRDLKQATMQQLLTGQTRLPGFRGEWEVKRLKTIVQTPVTDGPHLTPQFLDDGIPFLSVNNLVENRIDFSDLRFISQADHEVFSRKCKPRKNDILLGKAASVGKVALVELDIEFNIWSPIAMIRINCDNAPRFVYYQLQSADLIRQITLLTNSSSQGNIGMGDIEKLTLNLPPLPEQTAIAEVLTEMDAELAALEQRREKTGDLKQAMMQELLTGKTRLV
jgi:type I restriction enzyme S subunit